MLDQAIINQVTSLFQELKNEYTFEVTVNEILAQKQELLNLLNDVASCSPKVKVNVNNGEDLSFSILKKR